MNEFILKEKHKYWDNKITLEEYIKNIEEYGYIDCSSNYDYEFWYILENLKKLNNLQSKIDKAIELIDKKISTETYQHLKKLYDDIDSVEEVWEDYEFEDLLDILKEDK